MALAAVISHCFDYYGAYFSFNDEFCSGYYDVYYYESYLNFSNCFHRFLFVGIFIMTSLVSYYLRVHNFIICFYFYLVFFDHVLTLFNLNVSYKFHSFFVYVMVASLIITMYFPQYEVIRSVHISTFVFVSILIALMEF